MSSSISPPPPGIPFKFRRKSSSSTYSDSIIQGSDDAFPCSPSQPSSFLAPLHPAQPDERTEWQADGDFDDLDRVMHGSQVEAENAIRPWPCHIPPFPHTLRPLPSLMTKFAFQSDAPLSYRTSPYSYASQMTYFYPQRDSAIADDREEYDLESMDIHIRETYFATSAERGRWLSSPIAPRVRCHAILPMRRHSSPPARENLRRQKTSYCVDEHEQKLTSPLATRDEDVRHSPSLPPSSPLSISNLSFLSDCEGDSVVDSRSNFDDCHFFTGTPELSISSTACTSPVHPVCTPNSYETPIIVLAHHPTDLPYHSVDSITSPHSHKAIEFRVHAPSAADFKLEDALSPLSQFELDLPEADPPKPPLSDTVKKPIRQHSAGPGLASDAIRGQDSPPPIQPLPMNSYREPPDVLLDNVGELCLNKRMKKRKGYITGNPGARQTRRRTTARFQGSSSDVKRRTGTGSRSSNLSEPPSKKPKVSHCKDDFKSRETKSRRSGTPQVKRSLRSPSVEGYDLESPCTPISADAVDIESHAALTGMLIEALATSRATSMDASALYLVLAQAHPRLTTERSKGELLIDIVAVLEAGRARCGMFEKVDGSRERSRHKRLDSRWFYVPERDEDQERASLISAIMPRQKRNETKKYKQYYYRPLDKISRWDPEDAP